MEYRELNEEEQKVILRKGTEPPFSGKYTDHRETGTYTCKRCGTPLYRSTDKFDSHCGWPSFDDEIPGAVRRKPDIDGVRTEIICASCGGHLGHVFEGEGHTSKNIRHCVNSISLDFVPSESAKAYFAGGCFWGVEYYYRSLEGVISTRVGYMGGGKDAPTYKEVCTGRTGHAEALEVTYDPSKVSFEELARLFFEIHDPTQIDRQGPDIGTQYRSEIFYTDREQKKISEKLIGILEKTGLRIATGLRDAGTFWGAEDYHQDYFAKNAMQPTCHSRIKRFP